MRSKKTILGLATVVLAASLAIVAGCAPDAAEPKASTVKEGAAQVIVNVEPRVDAVSSNEAQRLADKHLSYSSQCEDCHIGESDPVSAPKTDEGCRNCHDVNVLAAVTADLEDLDNRMANPHDSHIGDVDCMLCHANHSESEYYCLTCHPEPEYQDVLVP